MEYWARLVRRWNSRIERPTGPAENDRTLQAARWNLSEKLALAVLDRTLAIRASATRSSKAMVVGLIDGDLTLLELLGRSTPAVRFGSGNADTAGCRGERQARRACSPSCASRTSRGGAVRRFQAMVSLHGVEGRAVAGLRCEATARRRTAISQAGASDRFRLSVSRGCWVDARRASVLPLGGQVHRRVESEEGLSLLRETIQAAILTFRRLASWSTQST